jgi:hypothetical protein
MNFLRTRLSASTSTFFRSQLRAMHIQSIPMCMLTSTSSRTRVIYINIGTMIAYSSYDMQGRGRVITMPTSWLMSRRRSRSSLILPTRLSECFALGWNIHVLSGCWYVSVDRVAPELKSQIDAGKIDLTAIVNTHQYVESFWMSLIGTGLLTLHQ